MRSLTPWLSPDGLTWHAGHNFDLSGFEEYFREVDLYAEVGYDDCSFTVINFQEGPATLLLTGDIECGGGGKCGPMGDGTTWTSSDGVSWRAETTMPDGGEILGASSGFITLRDGSISTSMDGRTWTKGAFPPDALAPGASVNSPVPLAGGFVLPGVLVVKPGHTSGFDGCGVGVTDLSMHQAALWWSPDGKTWTRDVLSGNPSSYDSVSMYAYRLDDHTVMAQALVGNSHFEWVSRDGKSWTRVAKGKFGTFPNYQITVGRDHGLVGEAEEAGSDLSCFDASLNLVVLTQTGATPYGSRMVIGPTGVLVTDDGTRFWLGVPTGR